MSFKVLHLIDSGGMYGAEKMLLTLATSQLRAGLEPVIMSVGEHGIPEKPIEKEASAAGLQVCKWRMKPGLNLREAWKIVRYGKRNGFQIFHSHGYKFNVLLGLWPRKVRGLPLITTLHGYVNAPKYSKMWIYETIDKRILSRMDSVVVVNPLMKEIPAVSNISHTRLHDVPNGINLKNPPITAQEQDPSLTEFVAQHRPLLGIIGRLSREKGHDKLLQALPMLARQFPNIGLLIIGEGYERPGIERKISELKLESRVYLAGYKDNAAKYMKLMDVLIMPSDTEGLPITLLEAMANRTPIVASAVGGIPELLDNGNCGKLVGSGHPDAIAEAVASVLKESELAARMAERAYKRVKEHYSAEAMTQRYLRIYSSLLCREAGNEQVVQ